MMGFEGDVSKRGAIFGTTRIAKKNLVPLLMALCVGVGVSPAAFATASVTVQNNDVLEFNDAGNGNIKTAVSGSGSTGDPFIVTFDLQDGISVKTVDATTSVKSAKFIVGSNTYIDNNGLNANSNKITNVKAGDVSSASSTDAVNGGQLYTTNQNVSTNTTDIGTNQGNISTNQSKISTLQSNALQLSGGSYDAGNNKITNVKAGDVSSASSKDAVNGGQLYATNQNVSTNTGNITTNTNNISSLNTQANKPITFAANGGSVDRKLGETLDIKGGASTAGTYSNSNIKTKASGQSVDIQLANAPVFTGKLQAHGLDADSQKITHVAAGSAGTDAVNKNQLDAVSTTANAGFNLQASGSDQSTVKPNDTVNLKNSDSNIVVSKSASNNNVSFDLANNISVNKVTTGNSTLDTNGLTVSSGPKFTSNGIDAAGQKITGVLAGDVNASSKDAVNGGQLNTLGSSVAANLGGSAAFNDSTGKVDKPTYTFTDQSNTDHDFNDVGSALTYLNSGSALDAGIKYFHAKSTKADSDASGTDAVAIGPLATAGGDSSIAAGLSAATSAGTTHALAIGNSANAEADNSLALGNTANAALTSSTAIGDSAQALAENSIAVGSKTLALGAKATSIGATGAPVTTLTLGDDGTNLTSIDGIAVTATGTPLAPDGTYDTSAGQITAIAGVPMSDAQDVNNFIDRLKSGANLASGDNSVALGVGTFASGKSSVAAGDRVLAGNHAVGIGSNVVAGSHAVGIGPAASAGTSNSFAGGNGASVVGEAANGVAIGSNAQAGHGRVTDPSNSSQMIDAAGSSAVAIGDGAQAQMNHDVAVGAGAGSGSFGLPSADNDNVSIGHDAGADNFKGGRNVAIGPNAGKSRADDSDENVAIGNEAGLQRGGNYNIAIGKQAGGLNAESPVVGPLSTDNTISMGRDANATEDGAMAFGNQAKATGGNSIALGVNAKAVGGGFVALGSGSVADGSVNDPSATSFLTGNTAGSIFSIGSSGPTGIIRRIVNVAGGVKDTDAVNVGQLKGAQSKVAAALGGGVTVDANGNYSDITVGGTQYSTLSDAIAAGGGGGSTTVPSNIVSYHGGSGGADKLVTVDDPQSGTDAVNLQTLNRKRNHFLSVNSTFKDPNYGNGGASGANAIAIGANNGGIGDSAIAIGNGASAEKIQGIALGKKAKSKGDDATAIGYNSQADAKQSVVIGYSSRVENQSGKPLSDHGVAIGSKAHVTRINGTAIGRTAVVESAQGQAFGHNAYVHQKSDNAIAMGEKAVVNQDAKSAMAFGDNATVAQGATSSTAIGTTAQTSAANAYALGTGAHSTANSAYAQGNTARATGSRAFALGSKDGTETTASNTNAYAIGAGAQSGAINAYAIGAQARANKNSGPGNVGRDAFAIGTGALVNQQNAYAVGQSAMATAISAYAVGDSAKSSAEGAYAIGASAVSDKADAYAVGSNANADGVNAYALGNTAVASGQDAVAFGTSSTSAGQSSIAFGKGASATGSGVNAVAIGTGSKVEGENGIALGNGTTASGKNSLSIGTGSNVTGDGSGAFGDPNTVNGLGSYVVGNNNTVNTGIDNTFVLGNNVTPTQANSVVLGNKSTDRAATAETGVTLNGKSYTFKGQGSVGNGVVSVGDAGKERQLINVAAGKVGANSTDAINGSQLYATNQAVQKPITFAGDSGTNVDRTLNSTLNVKGGASGALTSGNIGVVGDSGSDTLNIRLAKKLTGLTSVQTGNSTLSNSGLTVDDGSNTTTYGADKISMNDGAGTTTTIQPGKVEVAGSGNTVTVNGNNGTVGGLTNTTFDPNNITSGQAATEDQLKQVNNGLTTSGLNFTGDNSGVNVHRDLGEALAIKGGASNATTAKNIVTKGNATNGSIQIDLAKQVDLGSDGSLTAGNSKLDNTGITVSGGANPVTLTNSGLDNGGNKITNVADGTVAAGSKDAVNGSQLDAVKTIANKGWNLSANGGAAKNVKPGDSIDVADGSNINVTQDAGGNLTIATVANPSFTSVTAGDSTLNTNGLNITGGPSITKTGINAGSKPITNVANGSAGTDAANISQLNSAAAAATTEVKKGTNVASVVKTTNSGDNHDIYTVNADGAKVDNTDGNLTVSSSTDANNLTTYTVGLANQLSVGGTNPVTINGDAGTVNGLTNTTFDASNITSGQAATEDQLKQVNNGLTASGLDFVGNDSNIIHKNLGQKLAIVGGASTTGSYSADNLKTVKNGSGQLEIQMAESPSFTRVTAGDSTLDTNGLSITGGPSITKTGINAGSKPITNVANGSAGTDAANISQLNSAAAAATTEVKKGTNVASVVKTTDSGDNHDIYTVNANGAKVANTDGNLTVSSSTDANNLTTYTVGLANQLSVGGANPVTINGNAGTVNGLTNKTFDANNITSGQAATEDQLKQVNNGLTASGLDFVGNDSNIIHKNLGQKLAIVGGASTGGNYSADNLKTVKNGSGQLEIQMAENPDFTSVVAGNSTLDSAGLTVDDGTNNTVYGSNGLSINGGTVAVTKNGLDNGDNKITNVAAGEVNGTSSDAVNGSQLDAVSTVANKGINVTTGQTGTGVVNGTSVANVAPGGTATFTADNNTIVTQNGTNIAIGVNPVLTGLTSVTAGSGSTTTVLTNGGVTVNGGTNGPVTLANTGLDNGNNTITNVAAGSIGAGSTDGINGGQLSDLAGGSYTGGTFTPTTPSTNGGIGNTGKNNISDAIAAAGQGFTAELNPISGTNGTTSGHSVPVKPGDTVDINAGQNIALNLGSGGLDVSTTPDLTATSLTTGNTSVDNSGVTVTGGPTGPVKVTSNAVSAGGNKITNVADGSIGTGSKDAVNGSQLYATEQKGFDVAPNTGGNVHRNLGQTLDIKGGATTAGTYSDGNIKTVSTANGVDIQLADNPTFSSVIAGNSTLDTTGLTIAGGPSITNSGIDAAGTKITNVAAGSAGTDAANISQLNNAAAAATSEVKAGTNVAGVVKTTGSNGQAIYTVNADGASVSAGSSAVSVTPSGPNANHVKDYAVDLASNTKTQIGHGETAYNTVQNKGLTFNGDTGTTGIKKLGDSVAINGDSNITTTGTSAGVGITLNNNLDLGSGGSVTTGKSKLDTNGLTVDDGTDNTVYGSNGLSINGGTVALTKGGLDNGGNKITDVANGSIAAGSTDAVNGGQLQTASTDLTNKGFDVAPNSGGNVHRNLGQTLDIKGGATTAGTYSDGNIKTVSTANGVDIQLADNPTFSSVIAGNSTLDTTGLTIAGGPSITNSGIDAAGTKITNVAAGSAGTDAANISQLNNAAAAATSEVKAGTNVAGVVKTTGSNGQAIYTVNADGASVSADSGLTVTPTAKPNNVTDYKVGLSAATQTSLGKADSALQSVQTQIDGTNVKSLTQGDNTANFESGKNIALTNDSGAIKVATKDDVNFDSVTLGSAGPKLSNDGSGNVKLGDGSGNPVKITNVANGSAANDAVNVSQLTGQNTTVTNKGLNFAGDSGSNVHRNLGSTLNLNGGETDASKLTATTDKNIGVAANGSDTLNIQLAKNLSGLNSVQVTGGPTISTSGIDMQGGNITNVGAPVNDGDAINKKYFDDNKTHYYSVNSSDKTAGSNYANDGATGSNALAAGLNAKASEKQSVAMGLGATADGTSKKFIGSTAIGSQSHAQGASVAIGPGAVATERKSIAMGNGAKAEGGLTGSTAIGSNSYATRDSVALGYAAKANYDAAVAIGKGATVAVGATRGVALGNGAKSLNGGATALGPLSTASGAFSIAMARHSNASKTDSIAIGRASTANVDGGVALGSQSVASTNAGVAGYTPPNASTSDQNAISATHSTLGAVGVGDAANNQYRQITGVAAGTQNSDAVNVAQLTAVQNTVSGQGLNFAGDTGSSVHRDLGKTLSIKGGASGSLTSGNIGVVTNGTDTLNVKLAQNVDLGSAGSVTTGNSVLDSTGLTVDDGTNKSVYGSNGIDINNGGVTLTKGGLDNGGNKITHVANGSIAAGSTDAVNGGQLQTASTDLTNKGFDVAPNSGGNVHRNLGQTLDIKGGASTAGTYTDSNIKTVSSANGVDIQLADNPSFTSVIAGNSTLDTTGLTIAGGPSITNSGIDAAGTKITNVANGAISPTSTDAINGSQLSTAAAKATTEVHAGTNVADVVKTTGSNGQAVYTVNADGASVSAGSAAVSVTPSGPNANNVKDYAVDLSVGSKADISKGVAAKDAVDNTGLTFNGDSGTTGIKKLGDSVAINGDNNITTTGTGAGVGIALNNNLDLGAAGSLTTGNSVINNGGLTVDDGTNKSVYGPNGIDINNGGVTLTRDGLNNGGNKITNVAAGTNANDAVNLSQLTGQSGNLTAKGLNFAGDSGTDVHRDLGKTLNITGGETDNSKLTTNNIGVVANGTDGLDIRLAKAVDLGADGSVTAGHSKLNTAGLTVDDGAGNKTSITTAGTSVTDGSLTTAIHAGGVTISGGANGTVAVTDTGLNNGNNRITNVAAGQLGSASTDGVNGSQLYALGDSAKTLLGGNAAYDTTTGKLSMSNIGGTGEDNVNDAIKAANAMANKPLTFKGGNGSSFDRHLGDAVTIAGDKDVSPLTGNIRTVTNTSDDGIVIQLAKNVDLSNAGSLVVGHSKLIDGRLTLSGGPQHNVVLGNGGLNNGGNQIVGVADGHVAATSDEAVNGSQLFNAQQSLTTDGINYSGDSGSGAHTDLGDTLAVTGGATSVAAANNIGVEADGKKLTLKLAKDVDLGNDGSIKTGNTTQDDDGLTVDDGTNTTKVAATGTTVTDGTNTSVYGANGLNINGGNVLLTNSGLIINGGPSITVSGINAGNQKITQVANGDVSATSTDAVNGSQLYDTNQNVQGLQNDALQWNGSLNGGSGAYDASHGGTNTPQKIANLADGDISSTSTDAINGSQLHQTNQDVVNIIGGNAGLNSDGTIKAPTNIGGTGKNTIDDAIAAANTAATAGWNVADANGNQNNIGPNGKVTFKGDSNISVDESGTDNDAAVGVSLNKNVDLSATGSVTTGNGKLDNTGLTVSGGANSDVVVGKNGLDNGNNKVTQVADGDVNATSKDAVNGSQLHGVADSAAKALGTTVDPNTGKIIAPTYTVNTAGGTTQNFDNVKDALENITGTNGGAAVGTKYFHTHSTKADSAATGADSTAIGPEAKASGKEAIAMGKAAAAKGEQSIAIGSGSKASGDVSTAVGPNAVASGKSSVAVGDKASASGEHATALGEASKADGKESVAIGHASTAARDNSVSVGSKGSERQITHVAPGSEGTDAVNVNQLDQGLNNVANWSKNYTDKRVDHLEHNANAGVASAMAMAGLPQAYMPSSSAAAAAVGHYRGESALAVGVSTITDSGRYIFKLDGTANTRGHFGASVGAAIVW